MLSHRLFEGIYSSYGEMSLLSTQCSDGIICCKNLIKLCVIIRIRGSLRSFTQKTHHEKYLFLHIGAMNKRHDPLKKV